MKALPSKKNSSLRTNEISISKLKGDRNKILSEIEAPVSVFDIPDSLSAKEILQTEWNTYCANKGTNPESKSAFKRWKMEKQDSELAKGISPEWGEAILKANKVTNKISNDSLLFKQNSLSEGPLGTKNQGNNKLGQGFEQTAVHFAITKVPGAVIAQQIIRDSGSTDFITVETWKTAREQMNPTSVTKQGKETIGNYKLLTDKNIIDSYKAFITSPNNTKCFGCPVAPTLSGHQIDRFSYNNSICIYNYDTKNQNFEFGNRNLELGAGTDIGVPNSEIENDIIKEISCMTCWLCNLPLVKQSPMKEGKPHGNPEPPHTEHVLNILDALFYLDLFETKDTQLMIDYNSYLEQHYYGESNKSNSMIKSNSTWGDVPNKAGFLEYINAVYKKQFTRDEPLTIYPGIISLNEAWLKIHDFKFEYLYAHPDCNYEKNDDSLLCIDENTNLVFNEAMANNLADRIWKNRLTPTGGLLDVLDLVSFKKDGKNQWKNNVLTCWKQRLDITADFINFKRGDKNKEKSFYGFVTLCSYINRLPNTIKDVMTNHKSIDFDEKLTLQQKEIPLVPTDEMLLTIMQILSYQIGNLASENNISLDVFVIFCNLNEKATSEIQTSLTNSKAPPLRTTRGFKNEAENLLKKQLQIVVFNKLFEKFSENLKNVVNTFSRLFYSLNKPDQNEKNRNIVISLVIAKIYIELIDVFVTLLENYSDGSFKNALKQYLETEKTIKKIKIQELIQSCNQPSITIDSLNDTSESSNQVDYDNDHVNFKKLYKENPIKGVVSFDFDDSTISKSDIPEKLKKQSETIFSALLKEGNDKIQEQNVIVNILSELQSSNKIIDDIILLDNQDTLYDENYLHVDDNKDTLVLIDIDNDSKTLPTNRMTMLGIKKTEDNTEKILTRKEFFDTYEGKNNLKKKFYLEIDGNYQEKTAGQISFMFINKEIKAEYIKILPNPMLGGGGDKTKRRTRRHKKTRKHNKKRVSRKYIPQL